MIKISDYIIPFVVILIIVYGIFKGVNVFDEFITGAKNGFKIIYTITPALIALIFAIELMKSSGALNVLCSFLSPVTNFLGIPEELTPLTILSPISGSGSVGMFERILKDNGPDGFIGRCASVMMGSSETTFYTIAVYFGAVKVINTRYTLKCALLADLCCLFVSLAVCRLFFG